MCIRDSANTHINLDQLEDYYEIPMDNGDRTGVNVVLEPQDNTGGSTTDPTDETPTNTTEPGDTNDGNSGDDSGRDSECPPNCILGDDVEDASADESSLFGAKSLLAGIVIVLLLAIGLLTRNIDDDDEGMDVDQTIIIEKEWQEETKQFVPELPPLAPPPSAEEE